MSEALTGKEFKSQLREGRPKMGLFVNSHSPTVAEQLAQQRLRLAVGGHPARTDG